QSVAQTCHEAEKAPLGSATTDAGVWLAPATNVPRTWLTWKVTVSPGRKPFPLKVVWEPAANIGWSAISPAVGGGPCALASGAAKTRRTPSRIALSAYRVTWVLMTVLPFLFPECARSGHRDRVL